MVPTVYYMHQACSVKQIVSYMYTYIIIIIWYNYQLVTYVSLFVSPLEVLFGRASIPRSSWLRT